MSPTLTAADAAAIGSECPSVLASSPLVGSGGQVIFGNTNWSPRELWGVGTEFLTVRNWQLRTGEFFGSRDVKSASKVCVLGQTIVAKLFQTADPVGQTIRIKNIPFRVIGVLDKKGANMVGDDQDDLILMPYTTARKRLQGSEFDNVNAIMVSAVSPVVMSDAEAEINALLAERHRIQPGDPPDFQVQNTTEIANVLGVITGTLTVMLSSIAGISLVVGGVGIMNIMLVSVTERTREIGIRMAVGARPRDILRQFLVEAILLSCIGGVIGFALGVGLSVGATSLINHFTSGTKWPVIISVPAAVISFVFAAAVGVFFGYYPARRASRLDPIESLRYE
jgi:putative ABC transport system permease protein